MLSSMENIPFASYLDLKDIYKQDLSRYGAKIRVLDNLVKYLSHVGKQEELNNLPLFNGTVMDLCELYELVIEKVN